MSQACNNCGSEEWVEERVIKLAGAPSEMPQLKSTPRQQRYRLRCAQCGVPYGETPKKKGGRERG